MGDIGQVAAAAGSIVDLVGNLLNKADRDAPDKEFNENLIKIQNGYADNDEDSLGILVQLLLLKAGYPPTPSRDPGLYRREIFHSLLIASAALIREREYAARYFASITKK